MKQNTEEKIKNRAYEIWEQQGSPEGKHDEHWEQAHREVHAAMGSQDSATGSTKSQSSKKSQPELVRDSGTATKKKRA